VTVGDTDERPAAVVALSGGLDSCVTAALAAQENRLALLHVTYGQRTAARERRAFDDIADAFGVPAGRRLVAELSYLARIGGSSLTDPARDVPADGARGSDIPNTYVPFRNTHILSVAVSWAEVIAAPRVYIGAVESDGSGYPDCRPAYFAAFQSLVDLGTRPETDVRIETPVLAMRKADIVRRGVELGAPLHLTWSCYQETERACGRCDSCVLRRRAFEEAGVADPIPYQDQAGSVPGLSM
jgi:7-cyano-7-deazaguanine synthase